jgi:hypothetical protein
VAKFDVASLVEPVLEPGEEVLTWVRVSYSGQTEPPAARRTGIEALSNPAPEPGSPELATFPAHRSMLLVLTGGRILVYQLAMSGKPKAYAGDVAIAVLRSCTFEPSRLGGHLGIDMVSMVNVALELAEGDGELFAAEVNASIEALTG